MLSSRPSPVVSSLVHVRATYKGRIVLVLLLLLIVFILTYVGLSLFIATQLVYVPQIPLYSTPAAFNTQYRDVTFPAREDHVSLRGWFIPGVRPDGSLTSQRTIIFVHGARTNRADKESGLLQLSVDLAHNGFAILAFDMRGMGQSPPAPLSLGYFEQRDVLGAVDFLRTGPLPYRNLGRPRMIGGWGVSMGAATLFMAAAQEPGIRAIVSDCAYADIIPTLEREVPKSDHLPPFFTPGILEAARAIYGMDFYADRPVDVVAQIAPRPIFFIHGDADTYIPPSNMQELATAARSAHSSHVQTWLVPGAAHARSFKVLSTSYVSRVVAFYRANLGPDSATTSTLKRAF